MSSNYWLIDWFGGPHLGSMSNCRVIKLLRNHQYWLFVMPRPQCKVLVRLQDWLVIETLSHLFVVSFASVTFSLNPVWSFVLNNSIIDHNSYLSSLLHSRPLIVFPFSWFLEPCSRSTSELSCLLSVTSIYIPKPSHVTFLGFVYNWSYISSYLKNWVYVCMPNQPIPIWMAILWSFSFVNL